MAGMADITCRLWNRLVSFNRRFINLYTKFTQSIARNRCTGSEEGSYIDSKTGGWIRSTELSGSCNRTEARSLPGDCLQKWKSLIVETFVKANVFFSFFFFFVCHSHRWRNKCSRRWRRRCPRPSRKSSRWKSRSQSHSTWWSMYPSLWWSLFQLRFQFTKQWCTATRAINACEIALLIVLRVNRCCPSTAHQRIFLTLHFEIIYFVNFVSLSLSLSFTFYRC